MNKYLTYAHDLELKIVQWFKPLPHFPASFKKWLGDNIWWIVLIGAIASTISSLVLISGFITLVSIVSGAAHYEAWYLNNTYYNWWNVVVALINLAFTVVVTILMWQSVGKLKDRQERGWHLLFIIALIDAAGSVLIDVLNLSFLGLVFSLIGVAIGMYIIFEFRSEFVKIDIVRAGKTRRARLAK